MVPLASGRDADVYAIDGDRVLRRYRHGGDVAAETAVMAYVGGFGFPVPVVYESGGTDMVMERLDGGTMRAAVVAGDVDPMEAAQILADLHVRLHSLPARLSADPSVRILHLDLHPNNVMLCSRGPVLIDWRNATEGPPDLDLALSALILAQFAVDGAHPLAVHATALLTGFLGRAGGDPLRLLPRAVGMRGADPAMTPDEIGRLDAAADLVRRCLARSYR